MEVYNSNSFFFNY